MQGRRPRDCSVPWKVTHQREGREECKERGRVDPTQTFLTKPVVRTKDQSTPNNVIGCSCHKPIM